MSNSEMSSDQQKELDSWRKDVLAADYEQFAESFWKNETVGETRIQLFIGLVTAVLAALVTLATATQTDISSEASGSSWFDDAKFAWIVVFSLLSLLFIGGTTFFRIVRRNCVTDEYKGAMHYIRLKYSELRPENYKPFPDTMEKNPKKQGSAKQKSTNDPAKKPSIGGLAHLVAIINGIVLAALVGFLSITFMDTDRFDKQILAVALALGAGGLTAWAQVWWSNHKRKAYRWDLEHTLGLDTETCPQKG